MKSVTFQINSALNPESWSVVRVAVLANVRPVGDCGGGSLPYAGYALRRTPASTHNVIVGAHTFKLSKRNLRSFEAPIKGSLGTDRVCEVPTKFRAHSLFNLLVFSDRGAAAGILPHQ